MIRGLSAQERHSSVTTQLLSAHQVALAIAC